MSIRYDLGSSFLLDAGGKAVFMVDVCVVSVFYATFLPGFSKGEKYV